MPYNEYNDDENIPILALFNLRLTSKTLGEAATQVLLQDAQITWQICRWSSFFTTSIENAVLAPSSTFAPNIKKIRFEFATRWLDWHGTGPSTYRDPFLISNQHDNEPYMQARFLIDNLPDILKSMPRLQSLQLETPTWKSKGEIIPYAPDLDCVMLAALTHGLIDGLVIANLEGLTTLDLKLPCTHDFLELSEKLSDATCNRLRHLGIGITDATGENGHRGYIQHATRERDNDDTYPASSLQKQYPNSVYNDGVFELVARCRNLITLEVSGTHYLNGSSLVLPDLLITLKLRRIRFDASYLGTLLSQVSKIYLDDVELTTGFWNDVWKILLLCLSLTYLETRLCTYARSNPHAPGVRDWLLRCDDNPDIVTPLDDEYGEYEGLREVIKMLVKRAGGREFYPAEYTIVDDLDDLSS